MNVQAVPTLTLGWAYERLARMGLLTRASLLHLRDRVVGIQVTAADSAVRVRLLA